MHTFNSWHKSALSFLTFFLLCRTAVSEWDVVDWRTLPQPQPDDKIAVYYLVAPLLETQYNDLFSYFRMYHAALGFTNLNTNFSVTMDYDADNFVRASLFPSLVTDSNGEIVDLQWDNGGANYIYLDINSTYWSEGQTLLGHISGNGFQQFLKGWNSQVNESHPYYDLFAVADHWNGQTFLPSFDCFDYAFSALRVLYDLGASFDKQMTLRKNVAHIYALSAPQNVTDRYNQEPQTRSDILRFYEFTQGKLKGSNVLDFIKELLETFGGRFFYRVSEDYWQVNLNWPFVGISWWQTQPLLTLDHSKPMMYL